MTGDGALDEALRLVRQSVRPLTAAARRCLTDRMDDLVAAVAADLVAKALCDPSVGSIAEAACSAGCRALATHRVAHVLAVERGRPLARLLADGVVASTGVDVHYSAEIEPGIVLDHAPVIIGETAVVRQGAYIAGATLGVRHWPAERAARRHPIVEEDCFVGPGSLILGPVRIGKGCRVGAGAIVTADVDDGAVVGAHAVVKAPVGTRAKIGFGAVVTADVPPEARVGDRATWAVLQTT